MNPPPLFVFDIETVPDPIAGSRLLRMEGASRAEIAEALRAYHLERSNGTNDFLRQPFWEVVAISYAYVDVEGRPMPRSMTRSRPAGTYIRGFRAIQKWCRSRYRLARATDPVTSYTPPGTWTRESRAIQRGNRHESRRPPQGRNRPRDPRSQ